MPNVKVFKILMAAGLIAAILVGCQTEGPGAPKGKPEGGGPKDTSSTTGSAGAATTGDTKPGNANSNTPGSTAVDGKQIPKAAVQPSVVKEAPVTPAPAPDKDYATKVKGAKRGPKEMTEADKQDPDYHPPVGDLEKLAGQWRKYSELDEKIRKGMIEKHMKPLNFMFDFQRDGTFKFFEGPEGNEKIVSGTVQFKDGIYTLSPLKVNGMKAKGSGDDIVFRFKMSDDGKFIESIVDSGGGKQHDMVFKKL